MTGPQKRLNWWNKLIKFDGHFLRIWMDMKKGAKLVSLRASYASNVTLQNVVSSHLWCTGPLNSILLLACYVMTTMHKLHNAKQHVPKMVNAFCFSCFSKKFLFLFPFQSHARIQSFKTNEEPWSVNLYIFSWCQSAPEIPHAINWAVRANIIGIPLILKGKHTEICPFTYTKKNYKERCYSYSNYSEI